jgi:hypothetical protein
LIGDSHSDYYGNARGDFGFFGQRLQEIFSETDAMDVLAVSGSTPQWWLLGRPTVYGCTVSLAGQLATSAVTPSIADMGDQYDVIVIEQGANMQPQSTGTNVSEISAFLKILRPKTAFWVGAPPAPASIYPEEMQARLESALTSYVYPCTFLSSHFFTFEQGKTHDEHLSEHAAGLWAEGIAARIRQALAKQEAN